MVQVGIPTILKYDCAPDDSLLRVKNIATVDNIGRQHYPHQSPRTPHCLYLAFWTCSSFIHLQSVLSVYFFCMAPLLFELLKKIWGISAAVQLRT